MQPMKPMSFGEILDGAFKIYRGHFVPMFLTALLCYAPFVVAGAGVGMSLGAGEDPAALAAAGVAILVSLPLIVVGLGVSWGGVAFQVSEAYLGRPVTVGAGMRAGFRSLLPIFAAMFMTFAVMAIGLLFFIVPGIIAMGIFFAAIPVVVIERRGPVEAMGRSRVLARGAVVRILGVLTVASLIAALPGWALTLVTAATTLMSHTTEPSVAMLVGTQGLRLVLTALTTPFSIGATVLLYYDRRIRAEALDVQMLAEQIPALPA